MYILHLQYSKKMKNKRVFMISVRILPYFFFKNWRTNFFLVANCWQRGGTHGQLISFIESDILGNFEYCKIIFFSDVNVLYNV